MAENKFSIEDISESVRSLADNAIPECNNRFDFLYKFVKLLSGDIDIISNPSEYEKNGGSLSIKSDDSFVIKLPPYTSMIRNNFTVAHELGHYFLHYLMDDRQKTVFYHYGTSDEEDAANEFAASFLMPKEDFRNKCKEFDYSILKLAAYYQVSTSAVEFRINSLR